jgi:hypothetical protein
MSLGVERLVMATDLIDLKSMRRQLRFALPNVNGVTVPGIDIDGKMLAVGILDELADVIAKEFQPRLEELHRLGQSLTLIDT